MLSRPFSSFSPPGWTAQPRHFCRRMRGVPGKENSFATATFMLLSQCPRGNKMQRSHLPACIIFFKTILRPISPSLKNNTHQEYRRLGTGSLRLMLTAPGVCFWGEISAIHFTETMARTSLGKAAIQHRSSCSIHTDQGKHIPTLKLPGYQSTGQSVGQILENSH